MSQMIRWRPMNDLVSLREAMDRLFEDSFVTFRNWPASPAMTEPSVDVYETASEVVVKAALPGIKPEDVNITLTGDLLTIAGETKEETEQKDKNYIRRERRYGSFSRSVSVPEGVESEKADAKFENGVLTLTLPKAEQAKPKVIKIKPA